MRREEGPLLREQAGSAQSQAVPELHPPGTQVAGIPPMWQMPTDSLWQERGREGLRDGGVEGSSPARTKGLGSWREPPRALGPPQRPGT